MNISLAIYKQADPSLVPRSKNYSINLNVSSRISFRGQNYSCAITRRDVHVGDVQEKGPRG